LQPSLSLILPVHNVEKTLCDNVHRVLDVLAELASRFEVLVVDDGSTDHTSEVAHELAREFPQVRVARHDKRRGREAVASTAAAQAQGEVLLLQAEGEALNATELRRLWQQRTAPTSEMPKPPQLPQPLSASLLQQLSRWGEQLPASASRSLQVIDRKALIQSAATGATKPGDRSGSALRRPVSFLAHLRDLALGD
jgi:hypothetical protein